MESPTAIWVSAANEAESPRRAVANPAAAHNAKTASKRSGWRGTISSRVCGNSARQTLKACRILTSSPSRVLPATISPRAPFHRSITASGCGASSRSANLRLPVTRTGSAPRSRNRPASASDWAQTRRKSPSMARASGRKREYERQDCSDRRPFASTAGTSPRRASRSILGQSSVSIRISSRGRKAARKRRTIQPAS